MSTSRAAAARLARGRPALARADAVVAQHPDRPPTTAGRRASSRRHPGAGGRDPELAQRRRSCPRLRSGPESKMWLPASVATPIPARASASRCAGSAGGAGMSTLLGTPRAVCGTSTLADHEVGRAEQLAARLEERVGVGLVEDQVAEQEQPGHAHAPLDELLDSSRMNASSSQSRGVGVVGVDLEHGDPRLLEGARDEVAAPRLGGDEVDDAVDAVGLRLLQVPRARPSPASRGSR